MVIHCNNSSTIFIILRTLILCKLILYSPPILLLVFFQFLPYPELMPMRLTPQFTNLCLPHKHSGQLRSCMIHTMRALHSSPSALLNTMDVFIKEPSVDWKV